MRNVSDDANAEPVSKDQCEVDNIRAKRARLPATSLLAYDRSSRQRARNGPMSLDQSSIGVGPTVMRHTIAPPHFDDGEANINLRPQ
jgi:hypothetical protein